MDDEQSNESRPTPGRDDEAVMNFLRALGKDLSQGRAAQLAESWDVPALVLSEQAVIAVSSRQEVERFFAAAGADYHKRGITSTRPEILRIAWISDRVVQVDVGWTNLDARGDQAGHEVTSYTLRRDDGGALKIRVAILHPS